VARATAKYQITAEDKTREALRNVKKNFAGADKAANNLQKTLIGLVSVGTVAWLTRSTKQAIEFADAIAKSADAVGLSTDALQEFRYAAERSGISTSQLESNMTAFVKRIGELRQNTGPLNQALNKYNTELADALRNSSNQEEALRILAEAMNNAENATEQAYLANAAFGRSGVNMVNMLRDGTQGLADFQQQAQSLGVVMDAELIRKSEVLNDTFDVMAQQVGVRLKSAFIEVAAAIGPFLNIFTDLEAAKDALAEKDAEIIAMQEHFLRVEERAMPLLAGRIEAARQERDEIAAQVVAMERRNKALERLEELKGAGGLPGIIQPSALGNKGPEGGEEKDVAEDPEIIYGLQLKEELVRLENQKQYELWWIRANSQKSYAKFLAQTTKAQTKQVVGELVNMTQGVAQQNRAMFEINKVAGIANAVINTYQGVTNALAAYPPPLSFAMAAAQMAAGMAQVSAIKSTSFGGGGGAPSLAGSGGAVPTIAVDQQGATVEEAAPQTQVTVNISGGVHDSNAVRDLIAAIDDELGDGVILEANVY